MAGAKNGSSGSVLLFRELSDDQAFELDLSGMIAAEGLTASVIGGRGRVALSGKTLVVSVPEKLDFIWVKIK